MARTKQANKTTMVTSTNQEQLSQLANESMNLINSNKNIEFVEILNKPRKFTAIYVADKTLALGVGGVASSIEEARKITDEKLFKQGYNLTDEHKISVTFHD